MFHPPIRYPAVRFNVVFEVELCAMSSNVASAEPLEKLAVSCGHFGSRALQVTAKFWADDPVVTVGTPATLKLLLPPKSFPNEMDPGKRLPPKRLTDPPTPEPWLR